MLSRMPSGTGRAGAKRPGQHRARRYSRIKRDLTKGRRSCEDDQLAGRLAFVAGLVAAPVLTLAARGQLPVQTIEAGTVTLALAGVLVGFGSVWGNGCTSGHGVCGLSRLSIRALVATITFMATGFATVLVARHWS